MTRQSVWNLTEPEPTKCPACGSIKLRVKMTFVTGLKKIKDGTLVRCSDCNWARKYY